MRPESRPCLDEEVIAEFQEVYKAVYPVVTASSSAAVTTSSIITTTAASATNMTTSQTSQSSLCSLTWFAGLTSNLPKMSTFDRPIPQNDDQIDNQRPSIQTISSHHHVSTLSQTPYNLVKRRSVVTQCTGVKTEEKSTQTTPIPPNKAQDTITQKDISFNDSFVSIESDSADSDWQPDSDHEMEIEFDDNVAKERKFIVFESCLDRLLSKCFTCGTTTCVIKRTIGSGLVCNIQCLHCNHQTMWHSQPLCGSMPLGNLVLSAAVMFCGVSPVKVLRALDFASILNVSNSTFNLIQTSYLTPTIMRVWRSHQESMIQHIKDEGRSLKLAGDMRCCTPGHTAKYGSYSMLDLERNQVLDFQLIQSNEVRNSNAMELEGLKSMLLKESTKNLKQRERKKAVERLRTGLGP